MLSESNDIKTELVLSLLRKRGAQGKVFFQPEGQSVFQLVKLELSGAGSEPEMGSWPGSWA
ncbi:MAG: hypothetical protein LBR11_08850 [Deltaproteobacteria bacterium]|nr:hypothetical protein [Deltaproteobacteria bacterium]